ncbi:MAG: CRISPR-associated helicase Cas3' [Anaerolineales bacterium]|nr:CRISPR-associated helicase Cas3' [Anaerolineales bacterium]
MTRAENKANRLLQIEALLLSHPEGLTQAEIARKLGVDRSTVNRYFRDMPNQFPYYENGDGRLFIDRQAYLVNVRLGLHEAMAVHLATRMLATRMDRKNPHAASALRKLGLALERLAPRISQHVQQSADVMDEAAQRHDPVYLQSLEKLTLAWAEKHKAQIWHHSEKADKVFEYLLCPYFIEPYAVGQTTHVIGLSEPPGKIRTMKIERIKRVELTRDPYEIPPDFDPRSLLADAWGIWYTENEPVEVTLKFHPRVAQRVRETRWHRSEEETEQPDGSILWKAKVAEPQEMIPWIRGWGADCEVVGPEGLRKALEKETKRLAMVYGIGNIQPEDDLIAHRRKDGEEQSLITHLVEASQLAGEFAAKVGLSEIGKTMGLLHDFGKAGKVYQNYLRSAEGLINPDEDDYVDYKAKKGKIDHSTAGAQLVYQKLINRGREGKHLAQFLALAIASHHSGLIDCLKPDGANEFQRRIEKPDEDTHITEARQKLHLVEKQLDEILSQPIEKHFFERLMGMKDSEQDTTLPFKHGLLARFLLSCVLEADRLNTADFENPGNETIRNYGKYLPWEVLIERLEAKFAEFAQVTDKMEADSRAREVNELRTQVAKACLDMAGSPKGIYQLTVPTGGGKTLASLRFALHHAQAYKMDRVFYIVPYITIIDQNAGKVREILETESERDKIILEHHSNLTPEKETRRHNLLAENWDAPVVFTTQVQFLEALFDSGTRDARRMHQLANSVIILDEVQTVPIKVTHMFLAALKFLTHDCGSTIVLCTATQPPFENTGNPYRDLNITSEQHIVSNEPELFDKLKRVEVHDERKPGGMSYAEIADLAEQALQEKGSVLVVVNIRASAQVLYQEIKGRPLSAKVYHLSTNMCPAHRVDVLENKIKPKLKSNEPVICVSTQLIEAGVDIDFGAVIRALAGLDSIAQSAGRCNRHGVRDGLGSVWVVNLQDENLDKLTDIKTGRDHAQRVLDDFSDSPEAFGKDLIGLSAIAAYYNFYYQARKDQMDYPVSKDSSIGKDDNLFNLLSWNKDAVDSYQRTHQTHPDILLRQSFKSAAGEFRVMDAITRGVVVPYKEGGEVISDLCGAFALEKQGKLLKRAQRYSVNLFTHQFDKLCKAGAIREVQEGAGVFYLNEQYYSPEFGWSDKPVSDMTLHIV